MSWRIRFIAYTTFLLLVSVTISIAGTGPKDHRREAMQILNATDLKGGLIVHVGCGDGKLTPILHL